MKKLLLKDGSTIEAGEEYAMRLIEQGQAIGFVPEKKAQKAEEPKADEPKAEAKAPEASVTPKKKGK